MLWAPQSWPFSTKFNVFRKSQTTKDREKTQIQFCSFESLPKHLNFIVFWKMNSLRCWLLSWCEFSLNWLQFWIHRKKNIPISFVNFPSPKKNVPTFLSSKIVNEKHSCPRRIGLRKIWNLIWFARSHRYYDGPFCTLTQLCCVLKKIKIFTNFARNFLSHEVAKCTEKR